MKTLWSIALIAATAAAPAYSACSYPTNPGKSPDGATSEKPQMVAHISAVNAYKAEIEKYQQCIKDETAGQVPADWAKATEEERKAKWSEADNQKYSEISNLASQRMNAANDELYTAQTGLNEQIKAFNKKEKEKKEKQN